MIISFNEKNDKKTYHMLNVMRFISAILVVCIHTSPLGRYNETISGFILNCIIARIAVPFFFISSGYLFYYNYSKDNKYAYKFIKRLLILYLGWTSIYLIYDFGFILKSNNNIIKSILIYIRNLLFIGSHFHLWYLVSLIFSMIFIVIILKWFNIRILTVISIFLYTIGLLGDSYFGIIENNPISILIKVYSSIFDLTRNGICFAVPFITLGIIIQQFSVNLKIKKMYNVVLIVISSIIFFIEAFTLRYFNLSKDVNMYISLIILIPAIFILLLNSKISVKEDTSRACKNLSLGIYCCHGIFLIIFSKLLNIYNVSDNIILRLHTFY